MPSAIPLHHRPSLRRFGPMAIAVVALLCLFAAVYAWRAARLASANVAYPHPPTPVSAMVVRPEILPQWIEAIGSLQAVRQVTLSPEVAGRVVAINFEAGMNVAEGAPLVQLYDAPQRAERDGLLSRGRFAQLQNKRSQGLAPSGFVSQEVIQQREEELIQAKAAIDQLEAQITQRAIRAPFAGQIGIRRVNLGQYVNAGDALATLTALDALYVNFTVPQQQLFRLHVGGAVTFKTDAFPDRTFQATINAIEPIVAQDTRNVTVQAEFSNPDLLLRPGLYVTANIELPPRPDAIVLPTTAIQTTASGDSVMLVRDGKAVAAPVVTSQRIGDRVVVDRGVAAGDQVITVGQLRVQPGSPIAVANSTVSQ